MVKPPPTNILGPLAAHLEGARSHLLGQGYSPLSATNLLGVMSHLSRWLQAVGLKASELTRETLGTFFQERIRVGYTQFRTPRALDAILEYLEQAGIVSLPEPVAARKTPLDELLDEYQEFLVKERALVPMTVQMYERHARIFLSERFGSDCQQLSRLNSDDVIRFILRQSRRFSVGTAKYVVSALRSLLRFLHLRGDLATELADAVPAVAGWRQARLPKFISAQELQRLLASCDRQSFTGRRDFAVLLLLARLGLRACEVRALELDDIHWRTGEIFIRGKGRKNCLPLPSQVGKAIAAYLKHGRPRSTSRALFLSCKAPHRRFSTSSGVKSIVRGAAVRAGLSQRVGPHRLRHTAATQMLRRGASLSDIAQVLRHRSVDTTAIYAKVDRATLRAIAQPWPGGVA